MNDIPVMFKSTEPYFSKEKMGFKRNTFRKFCDNDGRFDILKRFLSQETTPMRIEIYKTCDNGFSTADSFIRSITDVTFFENIVIISW